MFWVFDFVVWLLADFGWFGVDCCGWVSDGKFVMLYLVLMRLGLVLFGFDLICGCLG